MQVVTQSQDHSRTQRLLGLRGCDLFSSPLTGGLRRGCRGCGDAQTPLPNLPPQGGKGQSFTHAQSVQYGKGFSAWTGPGRMQYALTKFRPIAGQDGAPAHHSLTVVAR